MIRLFALIFVALLNQIFLLFSRRRAFCWPDGPRIPSSRSTVPKLFPLSEDGTRLFHVGGTRSESLESTD
ncbi:hypothetical protein BDZ89DRAFT_1064189 [Hymenopellis radicata]|nr:hypothetical protein BDZ89DRAFT_1064189 [Hymenopellis radicata]